MKNPFRKLSYLTIPLATLLGVFASAVTASASTPTVTSGVDPTAAVYGGVRYRDFGLNNNEWDIGLMDYRVNSTVPRVNTTFYNSGGNWTTTNYIEFGYIPNAGGTDKIYTYVQNSRVAPYYLEWNIPDPAGVINYLQVSVRDINPISGVPADSVEFVITDLNNNPLPGVDFTFVADGTYPTWNIKDPTVFANGWVLKGTIKLSGSLVTDSNEKNELVEIKYGTVVMDNEAPLAVLTSVSPASVVPVNTTVTITSNLDDSSTGNSTIAGGSFTLDGGTTWVLMSAVDGTFNQVSEWVTGSFTPTVPGVYKVCVRGTDSKGNVSNSPDDWDCTMLVVYDPTAGFVTGGGWIMSPAGAMPLAPAMTGKANFGFVSKYLKGANTPTGNTEFQFKAGDLNFKSTSYEWLVVAGARAQYKGSGTINGQGDYQFILTAIDGQVSGGGGVDKFRIKIWTQDTVIYDNQPGAGDGDEPSTAIGGGSIVIHK